MKLPAHGRTKVLVYGLPGTGKTTLIERVIRKVTAPKRGFVTREVREAGRRVGFKIYTLDGKEAWLAKKGRGWPQVGKYRVFLETFEKLALTALKDQLSPETLYVVDEIGKMEVFSEGFRKRIQELLQGPEPLLASVGYGHVPFLEEIHRLEGPIFCEITKENRDYLVERILLEFERPGRLIVFEGLDGSGKSTLAQEVYRGLKKEGYPVLFTQEPTKGEWGEKIREHLRRRTPLSPQAYAELFWRDRWEHAQKVIVPALKDGKWVICDRYYLSTLAYQGAEGLSWKELWRRNETIAPVPDLVVFLDLPLEEALKRIQKRGEALENFERPEKLAAIAELYEEILPRFKTLKLSGLKDPKALAEEVYRALPHPNRS